MASLTNDSVSHIVDQLKVCHCGKCGQTLKDPKILACAHSVCSTCIDLDAIEGDQFPCPVCGTLTNKPEGGLQSVNGNDFVSLLFDTLNSIGLKPSCHWCRNKGDVDVSADFTCTDCSINLCGSCNQSHSTFPIAAGHTVIDSKSVLHYPKKYCAEIENCCTKHPQKKKEVFCKKCHQFLCVLCGVVDSTHPDDFGQKHDCIEIPRMMQKDKDELKKSIANMESKITTLRKQMQTIHSDGREMIKSRKVIEERIKNESEIIHNEITKKTKKLMKDVADIFDPRESSMTEQWQKLEEKLDVLSAETAKCSYSHKYHTAAPLHDVMVKSTALEKDKILDIKLNFKSVTYERPSNMSAVQTAMEEFFGKIVEHTVLEEPPTLTHTKDVAYSGITNSYYAGGAKSGLWASDDGRLKKVHTEESWGLSTNATGQLLYSAAVADKVNVFELSPMEDPQLVRTIHIGVSVQSVCRADDGRMAVIEWNERKVSIIGQYENLQHEMEEIFSGGRPQYGAWIGEDELCISVDMGTAPSKVMSVSTKRNCILWEVELAKAWTVSCVGHLLYIARNPTTNRVTVVTKKGVRIGEISCPDGVLKRVIPNKNNRSVLTAVSSKQQ